MPRRPPAATLMGLVASLAACQPAPPPSTVVIRAGHMIDGHSDLVLADQRVTVRKGLIVDIAPDTGPVPRSDADTLVVDARGKTLMPGLIDAHVHLGGSGGCTPGVGAGIGQVARNLYGLLAGGITTTADTAAPLAVALGAREWAGTARSRGPRVFVAGPMLTVPDGYLTGFDGRLVDIGMALPLEDPQHADQIVRRLHDAGVDFIKVGLQRENFDGTLMPFIDETLLCSVVQSAHKLELRVLAHATERATFEAAITCGVDGFVHSPLEPLSEETVTRLKTESLVITPTLSVFEGLLWGPENPDYLDRPEARRVLGDDTRENLLAFAAASRDSGDFLPDLLMPGIRRARAEEARRRVGRNVRALSEAGVGVALGTDGGNCFNYIGTHVLELERMAGEGLSNLAVLRAATSGSARLLNLHDALGRVAVGYRGDLIVVEGRPDQDLAALSRVHRIFIDGVEQDPEPPGLFESLSLGWAMARAALGAPELP